MIKKLVLVFIAFIAVQSYAQESSASPYSFYGIGSLKFKGTVENASMGGLSIYSDSIHINLRNPASYAGKNIAYYGNESRPVKYTIGGSHINTKLTSDTNSDKVSSSTLNYLAISIPMGKFGFGFGILPFTSVGYKLETKNENNDVLNRFRGDGGVNKAYFSLGYQITNDLSIGTDISYNFGNIKNSTIEFGYNNEGQPLQRQSRENNRSDLSGLSFNIGLIYKKMLNDKIELISGLTYTPKSNLNSNNERSISTITISNITGQEFVLNTIEVDLGTLETTDLNLPSKFSFGAGIGQAHMWFVGAEYTLLNASEFSNVLYSSTETVYEDASAFSLGGFYIPKYNSFTSYFKRVVYRAGIRFENTGLNINSETINEFGISFGLGLPIGNAFSNANIGVEIGNRGTTDNNLIKENFVNFQISFSLNDRWFQKRKYD